MQIKIPPKLTDKVANKMTTKMAGATNVVKQAGGGVSKYTDPESFQVDTIEGPVLQALKEAYDHLETKSQPFDEFLRFMASERSNAMGAAQNQDLSHPLSNYFISSSHNTYLTGHQLYGTANVDGYKNVRIPLLPHLQGFKLLESLEL